MTIFSLIRKCADEIEAAILKRHWPDAIRLSEEAMRVITDTVVADLLRYGIDAQIPRNRTLALYLGRSEKLGRLKVGITSNPARRVKEINASLRHLAFAQDFEIIHYGFAPEQLTRNSERGILATLNHYSAGGEWFTSQDEVFTTIFDECEYLEYQHSLFLRNFSIEPDLRAVAPANAAMLYPPSERDMRAHLERLTKLLHEWTKLQTEIYSVLDKRARDFRVFDRQRPLLGGESP